MGASIYRGWMIKYYASNPVTGQYVASKHGVEVSANSRVAIERVIDFKEESAKGPWIIPPH